MTEAVNMNIPETIELTDSDYAAQNKFRVLKEGWFRFEVAGVKKTVSSKKGTFGLKIRCNPLDEEGIPQKVSCFKDLWLPVANPNVPGHKAPRTLGFVQELSLALDPNFPRYPRKTGHGTYETQDGQEVDLAKKKEVAAEIDRMCGANVEKWWEDPTTLQDKVFYGQVIHEDGMDGNTYAKIERVRPTPPETGEPIITEDFVA